MPLFAWFTIPSLLLVAFVVVVVAQKPDAADAIATVIGALERLLRVITPWAQRHKPDPHATEDDGSRRIDA